MRFKLTNTFIKKVDVYVFLLCSNIKKELDRIKKIMKIDKIPKKLIEDFNGKIGDEKILYLDDKEIYFIGYGKNKDCDEKSLYSIFGKLGRSFSNSTKNIWIDMFNPIGITGFILGEYSFKMTELKKSKKEGVVYFYNKNRKMNGEYIERMEEAIEQNKVRTLINRPANDLNSRRYIEYMRKNLEREVKMKVLKEGELKKLGLNLILAVNAGSSNPCYLVILEYCSDKRYKKEKPICLVGKGVMFDSGGYNIKMGDFYDMKEDMAGSAIMYGVINLLAKTRTKGRYIALLPIVENMVDSKSTRPGDIIKSYSGKTVEIIDTDAEGRLILADAIAYSKNYNPKMIIDIATLTGGVQQVIGDKAIIMTGTKNGTISKVKSIGEDIHEKVWDLPVWDEFVSLTKSNIADVKNYTPGAHASTVMAAAFLYNFLPDQDKIDWVHLDNASVDYLASDTAERQSGGTGYGFRLIFNLIKNLS